MTVIATYDSYEKAALWANKLNVFAGLDIFEAKGNVIITNEKEGGIMTAQ